MTLIRRLSRITIVCSDLNRQADFYEAAFGFLRSGEAAIIEPAFGQLIGIIGATARVITLRLGEQQIELVAIQPGGRPYPGAVSGQNPVFQHFAIVVSDIASAYARLSAHRGWTAISTHGPQTLPASSGGVTAYKFRDPEGHPLELIAFAPDATPAVWRNSSATACLGIDHSAISIADTARSLRFYERLGLRRAGGSLNSGPAQERLDNVAGALVEVTALAPRFSTPHVELLCYRGEFDRVSTVLAPNDIAATRLVLAVENEEILQRLCAENFASRPADPVRFGDASLRAMLRDPDGHLLCLEASE